MNPNIDIPHIKTNLSRPDSRLDSNNDIFERDVQTEYKFNSPKSPGFNNFKIDNETDPKTKSKNPFLTNSPKELNSKFIDNKDDYPIFNRSFSFDSKTHSDNQLSKVPTHVLSVDDYINSDMDEKCYISTVHKHCNSQDCKDCEKYDTEKADSNMNKEYCDDFAERMDYFNHKQSSFDRYISENVTNLIKDSKRHDEKNSNKLFATPDSVMSAKDKELDSDDNDINCLTAEIVRSSMSNPIDEDEQDDCLSKEEFDTRKLDRERSRSFTSIIVKGLSKSCE